MRDYKQGKIYTIRCKYDDSLIYVGSTVERLCVRMARHRASSKQDKCINFPLYQEVNKTNWDDWFIELYEDCPCESKEQLNKREGQIIREIATLNKQVAGRTKQEYYRDNCEKINEKKKQYHRDNAAYFNEKKKQYRRENAERIKEWKKEYHRENSALINERQREKINCECGAIITRCGFARHKRSDKHAKKMEKMIDT
jgi:hypothetical protein